jgi:uncharacterized protein
VQNVICLSGFAYNLFIPDAALRQRGAAHLQHLARGDLRGRSGRLLPVTALDYSDLDVAVAELERMRARGSRIFLIPATR